MLWIQKFARKSIQLFRRRPRGTVRTTFSLSLIGILLSAALIGTEGSYVELSAEDLLVEKGELVKVDIFAISHVPVNAVDITMRFDGGRFDVTSVDRGQSVLTIWTEDPIINSNKVTLRGGTFRKGFLGEHKIATVELRAKETGASSFSIEDVMFLAGDGEGTPVSTTESAETTIELYIYDEETDLQSIEFAIKNDVITDITGNGDVDIADISAFMGAWANKNRVFDFDGDGRMSFKDFSILLADFFTK